MKEPLWVPSERWKSQANITRFTEFVNERHGLNIASYRDLHGWSVGNIPEFWAAVWEFTGIRASSGYTRVVEDLGKFPGTKWFPGARLNFAENLLRYKDERPALVFRREDMKSAVMTYAELYDSVAGLSGALRRSGVLPGDRVAAYMPNVMETAIAMLAAASLGAIWSSCGVELGTSAVLDRLGQINPKVLFTVDAQIHKGRTLDMLQNVGEIAARVSSIEKVVVLPYFIERPEIRGVRAAVFWNDFISRGEKEIHFEQLPFDHPLFVMFSSGTTGKPKCMVQGPGVLLNQLKELVIHTDLKREDRIVYITSPSWMMWNWLLSSLAVGAAVVLFDGNPGYPDWKTMWKLAQDERITVFGCSASYLNYLRGLDVKPGREYDLGALRAISQTGSPLSAEGFEWAYEAIKADMHFNSISGGTDINGCFAIGSPDQPVYAGELQGPGLGMKVKAYDETGRSVVDRQGELVCEAPAPSMPLCFWNDPDYRQYKKSYFSFFPGVWRHGDWIVRHGDTGGITFLGRSDFTLNPSGVRIGPAEIYNVVERIEGIADAMAVGRDRRGEQRIVLFVKLVPGYSLDDSLRDRIRSELLRNASPRHVPQVIIEAPEIPYTFNMKKVESSVTNILNGKTVTNREALINPDALDFYEQIAVELGSSD